MNSRHPLLSAALLAATTLMVHATEEADPVTQERTRANFARAVVLADDDKKAFADASAGFDSARSGTPRGSVESFEYDSSVTGRRRTACVYLPPGYTREQRYPVLYLLHGIAGNEYEWKGYIRADTVLDNLITDGKAVPMILVMPNGRALPDDRPPPADRVFTPENAAGFANFDRDLIDCLIPAVDAHYPVLADREHRAMAGFSMGGGQTLNFGFANLDTFAWLGGFASAPNTKNPAELVPDPAAVRKQLKLLYLSCGNKDGLINVSQGVHTYFKKHDIAHIWNVDEFGHDRETAANNLHHFAQRIFR